ncbi:MAG TPA: VOC family protein, partial [Bryobacteraceae bacterium]|nr:VOC family protein [Bryobacteraceae bacterium]
MGQGGAINWIDLTVPDAERVREFYETVAGWKSDPIEMGGYSDYVMSPRGGGASAGICHKRGPNADLPSVWLVYIAVANLQESLRQCKELGGSIVNEPRVMGDGKFAVIQDPAGAICAL